MSNLQKRRNSNFRIFCFRNMCNKTLCHFFSLKRKSTVVIRNQHAPIRQLSRLRLPWQV